MNKAELRTDLETRYARWATTMLSALGSMVLLLWNILSKKVGL